MAKSKVERVLHEFKTGTLRSSDGRLVTQRDQAIAIALAESEKARKRLMKMIGNAARAI